tara:strand:+ start:156 stop:503 length:348 start_codon:yes stop_codon:yes gene_type:complete
MERDFTYIDDIIEGTYKCFLKPATIDSIFDLTNPNLATSFAPHRIFNIGNSVPIKLMHFIDVSEDALGKKAIKEFTEMSLGDVLSTASYIKALESWINFSPSTSIEKGISKFAEW